MGFSLFLVLGQVIVSVLGNLGVWGVCVCVKLCSPALLSEETASPKFT